MLNSHPGSRPGHYGFGGIECIDAIEAALGHDGFVCFLRGQIIKYTWRLQHKGQAQEDVQKIQWYATRLEQVLADGSV